MCDIVSEPVMCCYPQLGVGLQDRRQGGDQEAVPTVPVRALRQAGLPGAEAPQTHEARERKNQLSHSRNNVCVIQ